MTSINIPFVTGISSVSGGGKTAVTQKLVELLKDALTLCFDAYDKTNIHPENLEAWLIEGGDYNAWETPVLTRDLQALTSGYHLTSPLDGSKVSPAEYVVFDAPLGRAHRDTGRFIDLMVFIDTPLDVAMARRLLRDMANAETNADEAVKRIGVELSSYLNGARQLYVEFQDRIKVQCDLVLDGCLSVDELAGEILARIPQP
jgi:uridine kinase